MGEVNNSIEIPIQDFKIRPDGIEIQPYGSQSDYFEFVEASKLKIPLSDFSIKKQYLEEKKKSGFSGTF